MYLFKTGLSFSFCLILFVVANASGEKSGLSPEEMSYDEMIEKLVVALRNYVVGEKIEFSDPVIQKIMEGLNSPQSQKLLGLDESLLHIAKEAVHRMPNEDAFVSYLDSKRVTEEKLINTIVLLFKVQKMELRQLAKEIENLLPKLYGLLRTLTLLTELKVMEQDVHSAERIVQHLNTLQYNIIELKKVLSELKDIYSKWPADDAPVETKFVKALRVFRLELRIKEITKSMKEMVDELARTDVPVKEEL